MTSFKICLLSLCLLMGTACSHQAKKIETISTSTTTNKENKMPKFTQREFLIRALEMMATATSIQDFTKEKLEQFFGVTMRRDEGEKNSYYFLSQLSPDWAQSMDFHQAPDGLYKIMFGYVSLPTKHTPLSSVCEMDFHEFIQLAEQKGFTVEPYTLHKAITVKPYPPDKGLIEGVYLNKGNLRVTVVPEFPHEANDKRKNCAERISIY